MRRTAQLGLAVMMGLMGPMVGCDDAPMVDHAYGPEAASLEVAQLAVTCPASLLRYPVNGPHNGGWDPNALTYSCPSHPSNARDNSDWIAGDHYGNDIFAARGTPMVAPVNGTITSLAITNIGGKTVNIRDACGWQYYHAHLDTQASDLFVGKTVQAGHRIGTVGNTGNASGTSPHLHFSIHPGTYTSGIDPFPLLQSVDSTACSGGGPTPTATPDVTVTVITRSPSGQATDFRPEGSSSGIRDLYQGQAFTADVIIKNKNTAAVATAVNVGVWFQSPYVTPISYQIHTDWPAKDQATWVLNDANNHPSNPARNAPPNSGKYHLYAMSPGESKRIRFSVRAAQYSIGKVDHPDVRAWLWHVADWYGEQTSWNDPVETNGAGGFRRAYKQHDIYSRTRWDFDADNVAETEGWSAVNGVSEVKVVGGWLASKQSGGDPHVHSPATRFKAADYDGVKLRVRTYGGDRVSRLYFRTAASNSYSESKAVSFVSPGDGEWHDLVVRLADVPGWSGDITRIRIDPAASSTQWYDIAWLKAATSAAWTSGDQDEDGFLGAPGLDCDDTDEDVNPAANEVCNDVDDDCDGATDEGVCQPVEEPDTTMGGGDDVDTMTETAEADTVGGGDPSDTGEGGGACFPGVTGPCTVVNAAAGCETGTRHCGGGTWGPCEPDPDCQGTPDTGDTAGSTDASDAGVDTAPAGSGGYSEVLRLEHRVQVDSYPVDGCRGAAGDPMPWLLALFGMAMIVRRARRRRLA